MKKVFVSNAGNAHKGICPLSFYKPSSSFLRLFTLFVHQSDARYLPLVLESPKFGESLSPDNIIFNIVLFSDIKTTTTQCTTEKKFILLPVHN